MSIGGGITSGVDALLAVSLSGYYLGIVIVYVGALVQTNLLPAGATR